MNVSLRPEDQRIIEQQLSAGQFQSVEEVVHVALSLLERQQADAAINTESCYDVLQKAGAIGMVKGGARDLSTNPEHMNGFGES